MIRTLAIAALTAVVLAVMSTAAVPVSATARVATAATVPDAASQSCGGVVHATPFRRSRAVKSNCAVAGWDGHRQVYVWAVPDTAREGRACLEGWGFDRAHPRGTWFSLGCGTSGSAAVPWGNVLAYPRVRAQSLNVPFGCPVRWAH